MRYRLSNPDFSFLRGITLHAGGAAIRDVRVGTSRVREPLHWDRPTFRVQRLGEGENQMVQVLFDRPDNWASLGLDLVIDGDATPRAQLMPLLPLPLDAVRAQLKTQRCVFLGTARNCGAAFEASIHKLRALAGLFGQAQIHVFENDSTDATGTRLAEMARDRLVVAHQDSGVDARLPLRTERLAFARNHLLDHVLALQPWDYVCWADLDGLVGARFTEDGFLSNFQLTEVWDGVFPLTWPIYYDLWALREDHLCSSDYVWDGKHRLNAALADGADIHAATQQLAPQRVKGWVPVRSAFAGFGLYKAEAARRGRYTGLVDGEEVCEHVPYNEALVRAGARLWLNPRCITHIV